MGRARTHNSPGRAENREARYGRELTPGGGGGEGGWSGKKIVINKL